VNSVQVVKVKYPLLNHPFVVILASIAILLGCPFFFIAGNLGAILPSTELGLFMGAFMMFALGPILIWMLVRWSKKVARASQNEAITKAASGPIEKYSYNGRKWGLAIAKDTVFVVHAGMLGIIPLTAIRDAWWDVPGHDVVRVYGTNVMAAAQAGFVNQAAKARAKERSGFYFAVADANNPHWFFHSADVRLLRQWNEVLTQAFERAGLASKAA
jgi:hypothetical protein